ncbi:MAG: hypothetical protein NTW29_15115 [Bacteroidetes bacterium]|nr:hypothetical protein [Bacteroidota bacterium]
MNQMIKLFILSFFIVTHCSAQLNEFTCTAPHNEWKFVLQLRADSTFRYEAFSNYGRWDLLLGKYKVKRNKLLLKPVSSEERDKLALTWGEEQQYASMIKNDTMANGQVMKIEIEKVKIVTTIPVSWDISLTRSSFFIIKSNRLYQQPVKKWPVMDPYFARVDSSRFDFRKLFR